MKTCKSCGVRKPAAEYYKHPSNRDGLFHKCKTCVKALSLKYYEVNREKVRTSQRRYEALPETRRRRVIQVTRWASRNAEKRAAHVAVRLAKRRGDLTPLPCEVCADPEVHAHHDDYNKPLAVRWLCAAHHAAHHKSVREAARASKEKQTT